jgi:hypothetical protein
MLVDELSEPQSLRPRPRVWLALVAAIAALHGLLLAGLPFGVTERAPRPVRTAPLEVRSLAPAAAAPVVLAVESPPPAVAVAPRPAPLRRKLRAPAATPLAEPIALADAAAPAAATPEADSPPIEATYLVAAAGATPRPAPASEAPPLYRTRMPPPATLRYDLKRGMLSGSGELSWRPAGHRYELRLEGRVAGLSILTQTSQGGFDEAGIAPVRYTDQRLRGGVQAANFQRERGKITYSGPSNEYPLLAGAQDRLSWMIQLAAVASAEPQRLAPGGRVVFFVSGARGDADVWVFRFVARERISTDAGPVNAVKFTREPRKPYDTQVEVWLDPARQYLPVRAKLAAPPNGDALELVLRELQSPP